MLMCDMVEFVIMYCIDVNDTRLYSNVEMTGYRLPNISDIDDIAQYLNDNTEHFCDRILACYHKGGVVWEVEE